MSYTVMEDQEMKGKVELDLGQRILQLIRDQNGTTLVEDLIWIGLLVVIVALMFLIMVPELWRELTGM